jgi:hypothetical protein
MPYTYLIGWSKHNRYYYGARWAKNCHPEDLWKTYFTSSKHVKKFRETYGEPDIIQVRRIFDNTETCKLYERKILKRLNVLSEERWLNKNINGMFLPTGPQSADHIEKRISKIRGSKNGMFGKSGNLNPFYGKKHTKETLEKLSKPKTEEHKSKLPFTTLNHISINCPHCNKFGQYVNMKRWHFDNCKSIPK